MYPRIKIFSMLILTSFILIVTTGCFTVNLSVNTRSFTEARPNATSPLFRCYVATENGSELYSSIVKVQGTGVTLAIGHDSPKGQSNGVYEIQNARYKIGTGKWVNVPRSKRGGGFPTFWVNNPKNGQESILAVEVTWRFVTMVEDEYGVLETKVTDNIRTENDRINIKFYQY